MPETLTTDGGSAYMSGQFQDSLKQYQVKHRVSSVSFPHSNMRSEVAVKVAKRLLRANIQSRGDPQLILVAHGKIDAERVVRD